jgi:DNA primase
MALFTKDTIDRVREAVDMVQLVGQKTDLRRVGTRWTGLCPFHDERTPSFSVNPEDKLYYCFGCGEGGDAFKFVQQTEALDFQEAVELLAEQSGVRVEREVDDPRAEERRRRRERLLSLLERATRFYSTYLRESAEAEPARQYLASRALSEEVLTEFRVGYSPSAWERRSPRSSSPSWPRSATAIAAAWSTSLSTRIELGATPCCAPRGWRMIGASICASSRCPRAQIQPIW